MNEEITLSFICEHALLNKFPGFVPAHSCPVRQRAPRRERNDAIGGFSSSPISRSDSRESPLGFPEAITGIVKAPGHKLDEFEPLIEALIKNRLSQTASLMITGRRSAEP